jgi:hypothetical protein
MLSDVLKETAGICRVGESLHVHQTRSWVKEKPNGVEEVGDKVVRAHAATRSVMDPALDASPKLVCAIRARSSSVRPDPITIGASSPRILAYDQIISDDAEGCMHIR